VALAAHKNKMQKPLLSNPILEQNGNQTSSVHSPFKNNIYGSVKELEPEEISPLEVNFVFETCFNLFLELLQSKMEKSRLIVYFIMSIKKLLKHR